MPSSSLLMHQKLSASMFLRASSWRLDTSKFSTSSSGGDKGEQRELVRNERRGDGGAGERKLEVKGIGRRQRDLLSTDGAGSSIMK